MNIYPSMLKKSLLTIAKSIISILWKWRLLMRIQIQPLSIQQPPQNPYSIKITRSVSRTLLYYSY